MDQHWGNDDFRAGRQRVCINSPDGKPRRVAGQNNTNRRTARDFF